MICYMQYKQCVLKLELDIVGSREKRPIQNIFGYLLEVNPRHL